MAMISVRKLRVTSQKQAWNGLVGVFLTVLLFAPAVLTAQSIEQEDKSKAFIGSWGPGIGRGLTRAGSEERGNCGGRLGDYGEKINNCGIPVDQLPLNKRGEAWLEFVDHAASPAQSECANLNIPSVSGSGVVISAYIDKIVLNYDDQMSLIPREVWMDGRGHPPAKFLWQQGHSIGRWDGDDLVVETTNFTFDPDGTDDHLHMASSVRKKVTERYQAIDRDHLRLIITLEDPVFLTRPFKFSFHLTRESGGLRAGWTNCDPDAARREIEYAYPGEKYR
jgi:hypothetical protein